jgi:hypothetical protein
VLTAIGFMVRPIEFNPKKLGMTSCLKSQIEIWERDIS